MNARIYRFCQEPIRREITNYERWRGEDRGLINCWEIGRELRETEAEMAEKADNGELPVLAWKGGARGDAKTNKKYGCLYYLAQWQGLRGEDLDIDWSEEREIVCSKTGMKVIYTSDAKKYNKTQNKV